MIDKQAIQAALTAGIANGADFAEVFFEDTRRTTVGYKDGKVETALSGCDYGAGVRVLSGTNCAYAYTCDVSEQALKQAALAAAQTLQAAKGEMCKDFVLRPTRPLQPAAVRPQDVSMAQRAQVAKRAYDAARAFSPEIVQAMSTVMDVHQHVVIANSTGVWVEDERSRARLAIQAVAAKGNEMQTGFEGPGAGAGFEFFDTLDIEGTARTAAETAVTMLHAPFCPAGRVPVVIDGGFGGVIFHEACGHSLEATAVARGNSEFAGKMGQQIANKKVTAVDDGTMQGEWGSIGYDDEGNPSQRNVLIRDGILTGYMIDILGGRRMNMAPTGSGRRQSYRFAPTSRMTNTFIADGTDENVLGEVADGLYAKRMGGGSVNPLTGEFNFAVTEGYWIRNGQIDRPVRGATLIGKGSEVLMRIDGVEKGVWLGQGMCGSISGSVPTNVGQPRIRVSEMIVGGRED